MTKRKMRTNRRKPRLESLEQRRLLASMSLRDFLTSSVHPSRDNVAEERQIVSTSPSSETVPQSVTTDRYFQIPVSGLADSVSPDLNDRSSTDRNDPVESSFHDGNTSEPESATESTDLDSNVDTASDFEPPSDRSHAESDSLDTESDSGDSRQPTGIRRIDFFASAPGTTYAIKYRGVTIGTFTSDSSGRAQLSIEPIDTTPVVPESRVSEQDSVADRGDLDSTTSVSTDSTDAVVDDSSSDVELHDAVLSDEYSNHDSPASGNSSDESPTGTNDVDNSIHDSASQHDSDPTNDSSGEDHSDNSQDDASSDVDTNMSDDNSDHSGNDQVAGDDPSESDGVGSVHDQNDADPTHESSEDDHSTGYGKWKAELSGLGYGEAEFKRKTDKSEFEVEVHGTTPNLLMDVRVDGVVIGQIRTDNDGNGKLKLEAGEDHDLPFPGDFPTIDAGARIEVGNLFSGQFTQASRDDD